jgi:3-isopropylmalate dehydrogenase
MVCIIDSVRLLGSSFPREPQRYRLVATTNLFGDILSDQVAGLAGGEGLAPSLNASRDHAMAQAVHGTAPDIAGKGVTNPAALILSTALQLRWFYQRGKQTACRDASERIERAVTQAIAARTTNPDLGGQATTQRLLRPLSLPWGAGEGRPCIYWRTTSEAFSPTLASPTLAALSDQTFA